MFEKFNNQIDCVNFISKQIKLAITKYGEADTKTALAFVLRIFEESTSEKMASELAIYDPENKYRGVMLTLSDDSETDGENAIEQAQG